CAVSRRQGTLPARTNANILRENDARLPRRDRRRGGPPAQPDRALPGTASAPRPLPTAAAAGAHKKCRTSWLPARIEHGRGRPFFHRFQRFAVGGAIECRENHLKTLLDKRLHVGMGEDVRLT